jgi:twinkle protein
MYKIFDFNLINVRGAEKGTKYSTCPICSEERKKKTDKCLAIYFDSGLAKCHHCGALSFKEQRQSTQIDKKYVKFDNTWINYTNLSDNLVKWVWKERMISQNTLNQFQITEEKHYQPAHNKEVNNIVFNYFEGEELVNKKYRSADKKFTQSKGGKPILYNINSAIGQEEVYICEGEFDVLAFYEIGIKNALSLPSGANDNDDFWINSEKYLKDVKHFIIATDNDEKGIEVREKIAQRLGRYRCTYIEFESKDANDDLKSGKLSHVINERKHFNIGGTFTSYDLLDSIIKLKEDGLPKTISPKKNVFGNLKDIFSIMMGQLTVITGIPSHGKSSFLDWYLLNLVHEYDYKASIYSPEHNPLELYATKHIQLAVGKPFFGNNNCTNEEIYRFIEWSRNRMYYTTQEQDKAPDWDWLFNKFEEQMFTYGINLFVIDAWNKIQMPKGMVGKEGIDIILTKLTNFCIKHNVHIFLVAHPTKMKKDAKGDYEMPTLYDVSGSSDFKNQTHNGFTIYRQFETEQESGFTMFSNQKTKFSFQGKIEGLVKFNYHLPTGRYYVDGTIPDNFDLTLQKNIKVEQEQVEMFSAMKPNEDFDAPF